MNRIEIVPFASNRLSKQRKPMNNSDLSILFKPTFESHLSWLIWVKTSCLKPSYGWWRFDSRSRLVPPKFGGDSLSRLVERPDSTIQSDAWWWWLVSRVRGQSQTRIDRSTKFIIIEFGGIGGGNGGGMQFKVQVRILAIANGESRKNKKKCSNEKCTEMARWLVIDVIAVSRVCLIRLY